MPTTTYRLSPSLAALDARYLPLLRLWTLRVLLRCNGATEFIGEQRMGNTMVARLLGFARSAPPRYSPGWALRRLQRDLDRLEAAAPPWPHDTPLARNVARLATTLGLGAAEAELLHFCALQQVAPEFAEALGLAGELTHASLCRLLAECLGRPIDELRRALDDRGPLARAAMLAVDHNQSYTFQRKIDVLEGLSEQLLLEHEDLLSLFASSVVRAAPAELALADYPQLEADLRLAAAWLGAAFDAPRRGVNILLHGRPGTGKTQLARALAAQLGATLLEIPSQDPCGKPRAGRHRFDSYRFAQSLLAGEARAMLVFDEVEDVFCESGSLRRDGANASGIKGWVNQLLETNAVPTVWVSNHLGAIDPAYRRRFDLVLAVDVPPPQVRRRLLQRQTAALALPPAWLDAAARHADLAPALVDRAARIGHAACTRVAGLEPAAVMTRLLDHALQAQGSPRLAVPDDSATLTWRPELLNADCDLEALQQGLARCGEGRLCLLGPPGTGKSAFGRALAERLGRPLLVRRASDILSPYVGEAERNIARLFDEARAERAVLLLDEADSLLRERRGALRSWEVTLVNEMLTQIESFSGVFVASTNLADTFDEAALRRFDLRVRFEALRPAQARVMFDELLGRLGLRADAGTTAALGRLGALTPGDFVAVARGSRLAPPADAAELLRRLQQLHAAKPSAQPARPLGFLAAA